MELAQDYVQWQALVLAVLNLRDLLPESPLSGQLDSSFCSLRSLGAAKPRVCGRHGWLLIALICVKCLLWLLFQNSLLALSLPFTKQFVRKYRTDISHLPTH
jgi:hypothetical protein